MGSPSKVDFVSEDTPATDAASPFTLFSYSLHADRAFLKDVFTQELVRARKQGGEQNGEFDST